MNDEGIKYVLDEVRKREDRYRDDWLKACETKGRLIALLEHLLEACKGSKELATTVKYVRKQLAEIEGKTPG